MNRTLDVLLSTVASSLRSWRGTSSSRATVQPNQNIILFDREGCPECRLVREALTALNLDVMVAPCPVGGKNLKALKKESGKDKVPMLFDSNTDERRTGAEEIITYLYKQYKGSPAPKKYDESLLNSASSRLATICRLNAGLTSKPARDVSEPLTLYSFESSPFSRPVRELLCELEIPYLLINLGKQQWADMGPARFRFSLKPYKPLPNTKREAFFKQHGNVQVPYLVDPNTDTQLFESKEILRYLYKTYAR